MEFEDDEIIAGEDLDLDDDLESLADEDLDDDPGSEPDDEELRRFMSE